MTTLNYINKTFRKIALFIFFTFSIFTAPLTAENIRSIVLKDLHFISETRATQVMDVQVGDVFDEGEINTAIKSLYALGYFEQIFSDYEDGVLSFSFIEHKNIGHIVFKGKFDNKSKDEISAMINLKKGDIYSKRKIRQAKKKILDILHKENFIDSQVELKEVIDVNLVNLTFEVKEGEHIFIENIFVSGNKNFDEETIKDELLLKEKHSYFSSFWFFDDGKLDFNKLIFDSAKLSEFYLQKGYLDISVQKHLIEVNKYNKKATMYVNVDEGVAYRLKDININVLDDENYNISPLKEKIFLGKGDIFDIRDFRKDIRIIKNEFRNYGYAKVQVNPDFKKDNKKINLLINVVKGDIWHINDVLISGNVKTQDLVIRRSIYVFLKDKYSYKDIEDSKTSLLRTGLFEDVKIEEQFLENNKINLIIKVKEQRTTQWIAGGGYSDLNGFFVDLTIEDSNTFGSGISSKISTTLSNTKQKYIININNPRIFHSSYSAGSSIYKKDELNLIYEKKSYGFIVNAGKKLSRDANAFMDFSSDNAEITDIDNNKTEDFYENALAFKIKYNSTDRFFDPTKGMTYTLSASFSGGLLGGNVNILDIYNYLTIHRTLEPYINLDSILNLKLSLNNVLSLDDKKVPIHKRMYLGGTKSVRGFIHSSISPTKDNKGGSDSFNASLEMSNAFPGQKTFRLIFFSDYGVIGNEDKQYANKASYGIALKIDTGIVPIAIFYSKPLLYDDEDNLKPISFVIGNTF